MTNALRVFLLAVVVGVVAGQEYQARSASGSSSVDNAIANSASTQNGDVSSSSVASSGSNAIPTTPPPFVTSKPARTLHAVVGRTLSSTRDSEAADLTQYTASSSTDSPLATQDPAATPSSTRKINMKTFRPVVVASTTNSDDTPLIGTSAPASAGLATSNNGIDAATRSFLTSPAALTGAGSTTPVSTLPTDAGTSGSADPSITTSDPATNSTPTRTITMKTFRPVVVGMTSNSDPASSTPNQANPATPGTTPPLALSGTPATFRATIVANGTTNSTTKSPSTPGSNGVTPSNNGITVAPPASPPSAAPSVSRNNVEGATALGANSPATAPNPSAATPSTTTRGQSASTGSATSSPGATGTKATPQSSSSTNSAATGQQATPSVLGNTTTSSNGSSTLEGTRFGDIVDNSNISTIRVARLDDGNGSGSSSSTIVQSSTSRSSGGFDVGDMGDTFSNGASQGDSRASGPEINSGTCASAVGVSAISILMALVVLW